MGMDDCPPPLVIFSVERSTESGITTSVGREMTLTRRVDVKYRDNRTSYIDRLWLAGEVELTNTRDQAARVRYRHSVPFDSWFIARPPAGSPACVEEGAVVALWEVRLDARESVTIDVSWSVDLFDRADLNRDGVVDVEDLGIFLTYYGTEQRIADLDDSGIVDGYDLGLLFSRWTG